MIKIIKVIIRVSYTIAPDQLFSLLDFWGLLRFRKEICFLANTSLKFIFLRETKKVSLGLLVRSLELFQSPQITLNPSFYSPITLCETKNGQLCFTTKIVWKLFIEKLGHQIKKSVATSFVSVLTLNLEATLVQFYNNQFFKKKIILRYFQCPNKNHKKEEKALENGKLMFLDCQKSVTFF